MIILAIETSCDETAIAVVENKGKSLRILSNVVFSQIKVHALYGGVVPNLAKREHQKNLAPILVSVLKKAKFFQPEADPPLAENLKFILERESDLLTAFLKFIPKIKVPKIDVIAVTVGPGLEPALWGGVNFARSLGYLWNKPIIPVNHLEGHIASVLLRQNRRISNLRFPAIALLVSGGHTQLVSISAKGGSASGWKYKVIGETRDDAVGEAFDKVARILGLGYPGGPAIAELARRWNFQFPISPSEADPPSADNFQIKLPRPMINQKNFDFSFSGLKTAVLYLVKDLKKQGINIEKITPAIAAEFQNAVIDVLIKKTMNAVKEYKVKTVILCGGVAANVELRKRLREVIREAYSASNLLIPDLIFTTDNAVMIAASASLHSKKEWKKWNKIKVNADLRLA